MERSLVADVALVKAWKADKAGNLVFRKTRQRNNMNRFTKECFKDLSKLTSKEQMHFFDECFSLPETIEIKGKHKLAKFNDVLINYFKNHCALTYRSKLNQNMGCYSSTQSEDRLKPVALEIFCGRFYFDSKLGSFRPGYLSRYVSSSIADFLLCKSAREIDSAWENVSGSLLSPSSSGRSLAQPTIVIGHSEGQHLYFMNDRENKQIKIGISYFPGVRIKQVERNYRRGALSIMHIVKGGGRELEANLHGRFSAIRVEGEREWFHYHKELFECIEDYRDQAH